MPPPYTRDQVRRRQILAASVLGVVVLVVVVSCGALIVNLVGGGEDDEPHIADHEAMQFPTTAADAPAATQLPDGVSLGEDDVMGIDVSNHQGSIDWEQVAGDGIGFAYIKATEGVGYVDPEFENNWQGARDAGVTAGAYHYFTLCSAGADQARDFLETVPVNDDAMPPALDLEFDGACDERPEADHAQQEVDEFTRIVEAAWGRRLVIYSSAEWREHYGVPVAEDRPAWIYREDGPPDSEWSVWQVRFDGAVAGIEGDVDIDVARPEQLREHARPPEGEPEE